MVSELISQRYLVLKRQKRVEEGACIRLFMSIEIRLIFAILFMTSVTASRSLRQFISRMKILVNDFPSTELKFCIGNESADADSIISSLCLAYYKSELSSPLNVVPICGIPSEDAILRRDIELLLQKVDLSMRDLIYLNDCRFEKIKECGCLKVTLVDHNLLSRTLSVLDDYVDEIVDHHQDSGSYANVVGMNREIAFDEACKKATVGSTCTLVAERFFLQPHLLTEDIATLLMGVIALDTQNMSAEAGKGTERDALALGRLSQISSHSLSALYAELRDCKTDRIYWSGLSASNAFRLDYKSFVIPRKQSAYGIASVILPIVDMMKKDDFESSLQSYLNSGLEVFAITSSFSDEASYHRELALFTKDYDLLENFAEFTLIEEGVSFQFMKNSETEEYLSKFATSFYGVVYHQGNLKMSRKQVAPFLTNFLSR